MYESPITLIQPLINPDMDRSISRSDDDNAYNDDCDGWCDNDTLLLWYHIWTNAVPVYFI